MGISRRKDDLAAATTRAFRDREAVADALAAVDQFNARLAAGKAIWAWPSIGAALASKHYWLIIGCEPCDTITDMDLSMKRRDLDTSIRIALRNVRCSRCNGHGRPRILALARFPSP